MAVDAVVGRVQNAVLEPLDRDVTRAKRPVADLGIRLDPVDAPTLFAPKTVGIADRTQIKRAILLVVDEGPFAPVGWDVIDFLGHAIPPRNGDNAHPVLAVLSLAML